MPGPEVTFEFSCADCRIAFIWRPPRYSGPFTFPEEPDVVWLGFARGQYVPGQAWEPDAAACPQCRLLAPRTVRES